MKKRKKEKERTTKTFRARDIHSYIHTYPCTYAAYLHTYTHTCVSAYLHTCIPTCLHSADLPTCMPYHSYLHTNLQSYLPSYYPPTYLYLHAYTTASWMCQSLKCGSIAVNRLICTEIGKPTHLNGLGITELSSMLMWQLMLCDSWYDLSGGVACA